MTHDEAYTDAMQKAYDDGYHEGALDQERMDDAEIERLKGEIERLRVLVHRLDDMSITLLDVATDLKNMHRNVGQP